MGIVFFGTPDFAVSSLETLVEEGERVLAVVTQPDRKKGRGHVLAAPPVKETAGRLGIPVMQPSNIRTPDFAAEIERLGPQCIAVVAYGKIIPPQILKLPPLGCVNVHASLLPKYRGAAPIQRSIMEGEIKTGVTTMMMDEGLDTGDILLQEEMEIADEDDASTLSRKLAAVGATLLVRTLRRLREGTLRPTPQAGIAGYAPPLRKEDGRIDWTRPARAIFNLVRGTSPWPGAYCHLLGEKIVILRAAVADSPEGGLPGRIVAIKDEEVYVSAGEGVLAVSEVKPEGRGRMTAAALMRGRRVKEGTSFDAA